MVRKITALALVVALAGLIASPVEAKKKKPAPAEMTYYMSWFGDCAGSGFLSFKYTEDEGQDCALFFPGIAANSYSFYGKDGTPFRLDASKMIPVDFELGHVATAAADFEVTLKATIDGESTELGSATQTITAATSAEPTRLHYEFEPDASLHGARVSELSLTITWTGSGFTYSSMNFSPSNTVVIGRLK